MCSWLNLAMFLKEYLNYLRFHLNKVKNVDNMVMNKGS
jgi:hypothetical protein